MDSWQGRNFDPVTLHKYLYANADMVDPSGQFSLGCVMSSIGVAANLYSTASTAYSVFQIASGEEEFSAKEAGIAILWSMIGSRANVLSKPLQKLLRNSGCLTNSFAAGTLVTTADGLVNIEDVSIGALVLSLNEATGETEYKTVIHIITSDDKKEIVEIGLSNGDKLEVTTEHLFYIQGSWVEAGDAQVGDQLHSLGESVKISSIKRSIINDRVYNLTVKDNHNYFVGIDPVLVHNISPCEKTAKATAQSLPKSCKQMFECKDFARRMESLLVRKEVRGKRICLKSRAGIYSDRVRANISDTGDHLAVKVGELVFDNLNPDGVPYQEWLNDLGGPSFIQRGGTGSGAEIELFEEEFGSQTGCR